MQNISTLRCLIEDTANENSVQVNFSMIKPQSRGRGNSGGDVGGGGVAATTPIFWDDHTMDTFLIIKLPVESLNSDNLIYIAFLAF